MRVAIQRTVPVVTLAVVTLAVVTLATSGVAVRAADSSQPASPIPNDVTNYQGDRVTFPKDMLVTIQGTDGGVLANGCLAAHTPLLGETAYSAPATDGGAQETGTLFQVTKTLRQKLSGGAISKDVAACDSSQLTPAEQTKYNSSAPIPIGRTIRITTQQLTNTPPNRYGLTYGALVVPFKYHLTGAKDFTGSATVGPYLGYRTENGSLGIGVSFVAFLGAANIAVPQTVNGGASSENLAGFSYGGGVIAHIKGGFQFGGVFGFDRVSSSADYAYNGKVWLAAELGYSFLQ